MGMTLTPSIDLRLRSMRIYNVFYRITLNSRTAALMQEELYG